MGMIPRCRAKYLCQSGEPTGATLKLKEWCWKEPLNFQVPFWELGTVEFFSMFQGGVI